MALKPSIHKFRLSLSDFDRDFYDSLSLTVARHPSETEERMLVRVLAWCLNADERLVFCKGLSEATEPDLWRHELDGSLALWIDVGEPAFDRLKKASRLARQVKVYSFNHKADTWWAKGRDEFLGLPVEFRQFPWAAVQALAALAGRGGEWHVSISEGNLHVSGEAGDCELPCRRLDAR